MVIFTTDLDSTNYSDFIKDGVVMIDVWAPWCGPCKQIGPIVDEISIDYKDKGVRVGKVDADQNKEIIASLGVRNIPAIIIFKNGEMVDKSVGMSTKATLEALLDKHI